MKKHYAVMLTAAAILVSASVTYAASMTVRIYAIDAKGVGGQIGTIQLSETKAAGLRISPRLAGLPPGQHGFHLHVNPSCDPGAGPNGQAAAGLAAGGHYDPANTGKHLGPHGDGHKGDLPVLIVDARGRATKSVVARWPTSRGIQS
jgi:Cu-Zn family superoxide dismutase